MPDILQTILARKRRQVGRIKAAAGRRGLARLRGMALSAPPCPDLAAALRRHPGPAVIAEIKRRSPSAGPLPGADLDIARRARAYRRGGAAAVSVLCDREFFGGSLADLARAAAAVDLPILCKDFIIDPVQIHQARLAGAAGVLLIVAALSPPQLRRLYRASREAGLTPLLEVHDRRQLDRALALNPRLVGINNRDLATMGVDLQTSLRLRPLIPAGITVVAESGISRPRHLRRLQAAGLDAFLIGTALMGPAHPRVVLSRLMERGRI